MSYPSQPEQARKANPPSLEDLLDQAEQVSTDLARQQAVGQSVADLSRELDRLANEDDGLRRRKE